MHIQGHGTGRPLGLTALELLVSLAVLGILVSIAVPTYRNFVLEQRIRAASNALHLDLLAARSEAVQRNTQVVACPGRPSNGCAASNDWDGGWMVFRDANGDRDLQHGEAIVRNAPRIDGVSIRSSRGRRDIRFFSNGSAPGSNTTISLCGPGGGKHARKLVISNIGRIRRERYPDIDLNLCSDPIP